jgi:deoxyribodipyrimidine photo-lyase
VNPAIVWFRQDLRLQDNPALAAAVRRGAPVIPVYVWDPEGEGRWPMGAASRWWLHHALVALDASLREKGSRLVVARGDSLTVLRKLMNAVGSRSVFWNRRYEPEAIERDGRVKAALDADGIEAADFNPTPCGTSRVGRSRCSLHFGGIAWRSPSSRRCASGPDR